MKFPALRGWFDSPDDWVGLDVGASVAQLDFFLWFDVITRDLGPRTGRPLPWLIWGTDWALYGPHAWGYYLSNVLLQTASGALLWLVLRRWVGPTTALLGAALVLLNPLSGQAARLLSARDDELALLFMLATVALWPRARTSVPASIATAALFLAALASKPTAVLLVALLPAFDVAELGRKEALRPARLARVFAPIGVAVVIASPGLWLLLTSRYGPVMGDHNAGTTSQVVLPLAHGLWLPFTARGAANWAAVADLGRLALIGTAVALGLHERRTDRRALIVGVTWLVASLVLPWSSMARSSDLLFMDGRYLLMPMVGLSIAMAGAIGPAEGRRAVLGLVAAAVVLSVGMYGAVTGPMNSNRGPAASLHAALQSAAQSTGPDGRVVVVARGLDPASSALLTAREWDSFVPEAAGRRPIVAIGGAVLQPVPAGPDGPASLRPTDPAAAEGLRSGTDVVVVQRGGRFEAVDPAVYYGSAAGSTQQR